MANVLYTHAKDLFLTGQINMTEPNTIKAALVNNDYYKFNVSHKFLSDVLCDSNGHHYGDGAYTTDAAIQNRSVYLENTAVVDGAFVADNVTFTDLASLYNTNIICSSIIIYKNFYNRPEISPLIAYIDIAKGLPITPSGLDITIFWNDDESKIFKL